MGLESNADENGRIVTYVRPALMDRPAMKTLPAGRTVASAVELFMSRPEGPDGQLVATQLAREMAGNFNYLAVRPGGRTEIIDGNTRLADIAVKKEIRTPHGLEEIHAVAIFVQSYMPVGRQAIADSDGGGSIEPPGG